MSAEDFEGVRYLAKANHAARVAKTPQRLSYAVEQLDKHDVTYKVCNETTGQINCYFANGNMLTFYAGTGKITGHSQRGIANFLKLCDVEVNRR